jgi:hypothetical protein
LEKDGRTEVPPKIRDEWHLIFETVNIEKTCKPNRDASRARKD